MRIYYRPGTGRPVRVAWLLEEIGAPYEPVAVSSEEVQQPEHRARHPLGRVPVGEADGSYIYESAALCLQIADENPGAEMIPPVGTHERALVYQWTFFAMAEIEPAAVEILRHRQTDPERSEAGRVRFAAAAAVVEAALEGREFLLGDRLTVADIVVAGVLSVGTMGGLGLLAELPNVSAYIERLLSRPAFVSAAAATESAFATRA